MTGASYSGVINPFEGVFSMSLISDVIRILFCLLLICQFFAFDITIVAVGSIAVLSVDGSTTHILAASYSASDLAICCCCTLRDTVYKTTSS